jgi:hypothetical protein
MDIEGASSLESLMGEPIVEQVAQQQMQQQQQQQPLPPMAPPMNTCTQEANPGSPAVVNTGDSKKKKQKYSKDEIQKLALYVLVAAVVVSLPTVQDKLIRFIPMLQNGGTNALIVNGALVAAAFYAILHFS